MKQLIRGDLRIVPGKGEHTQISHSLVFTDREGKEIKIELGLKLKETDNPENGGQEEIFLKYQDESYSFEYFAPAGDA